MIGEGKEQDVDAHRSEMPPATNPGGDGSQQKGSADLEELLANSSLSGIVLAIRTVVEENPRMMGGLVASRLMLGAVTTLGYEATTRRDEAAENNEKMDKVKDNLSKEKQKTACLTERIAGMNRMQTATQCCMTFASILVGVAVDGYKSNNTPLYLTTGGIALVLLVGSWIWPRLKGTNNV